MGVALARRGCGEKGGVGVSGPSPCCVPALLSARGVEPLSWLLLTSDDDDAVVSPVCGVRELRGVPRLMVRRRLRPPLAEGMTMSERG